MKNNVYIVALTVTAFVLSSCSTTNFSRVNQKDMLAVQSDFELKQSTAVAVEPTAALEQVVPTEIALYDKVETKTEQSDVPVSHVLEQQPSRKSVKAEMRQFTREEKKEIRKAVLYAYLGKDLPEPSMKKADGAPFIDRTAAAIIAFFIPPLGTGLYFGKDKRTWISLALTLLFWLPGAIYAIIVILKD